MVSCAVLALDKSLNKSTSYFLLCCCIKHDNGRRAIYLFWLHSENTFLAKYKIFQMFADEISHAESAHATDLHGNMFEILWVTSSLRSRQHNLCLWRVWDIWSKFTPTLWRCHALPLLYTSIVFFKDVWIIFAEKKTREKNVCFFLVKFLLQLSTEEPCWSIVSSFPMGVTVLAQSIT